MKKENIVQRVEAIITPAIEELGIELVDVEYLKEGPEWYLRVYIDQDEGIGLYECETVSRKIDKILDENDQGNSLFPGSYILEVSSPGITRPLKKDKDFQRSIGKLVTIKTYAPLDGKKEFTGILLEYNLNDIKLEVKDNEIILPKEKISIVHLAFDFY